VSFTGRQEELGQLAKAAAGSGGVAGIYAIGGMAGVGKTAFAVHGQIFPPLHGHTPGLAPGEALGIFRDLGDRAGEPGALNEKGTLHRASGDLAQAQGCHQQALEQARAIASPSAEAHALAGLGRCALAAGHADEAADMLRKAQGIFQRIGAAEAAGVSAELDAATEAQPAAPRSRPPAPPGPGPANPPRWSRTSYHWRPCSQRASPKPRSGTCPRTFPAT
jgi:tetratricopeptide (TPR) repeat protein